MKLVNWNVGRAGSGSNVDRDQRIRNEIERHGPEIACLTEANCALLERWDGDRIASGSGYKARKVLLWSRKLWRCVDCIGDDRLPPDRFMSAVTRTSLGDLTVIGVCIPWYGSRRKEGKESWDDHKEYLKHLGGVLSRAPGERLVVMGDFNQNILRRRQRGSAAGCRAELLRRAVSGCVELRPLDEKAIDHIGLSADMAYQSLSAIGRGLAERGRSGVVADVAFRSR